MTQPPIATPGNLAPLDGLERLGRRIAVQDPHRFLRPALRAGRRFHCRFVGRHHHRLIAEWALLHGP